MPVSFHTYGIAVLSKCMLSLLIVFMTSLQQTVLYSQFSAFAFSFR